MAKDFAWERGKSYVELYGAALCALKAARGITCESILAEPGRGDMLATLFVLAAPAHRLLTPRRCGLLESAAPARRPAW